MGRVVLTMNEKIPIPVKEIISDASGNRIGKNHQNAENLLRNLLNTLQKTNQSNFWRSTRSSPTKSLKTRSFAFSSATNSIGSPTKRVGEARMQFESFKLRGNLSRGAHKAMPRAPHGETPRSVVRIYYPLPFF